jgi:hypothetical protein
VQRARSATPFALAPTGIDDTCGTFSLDGSSCIDPDRAVQALIVVNGLTALVATVAVREASIQAVWDMEIPTGSDRYYAGILYLTGLLVLGGQYQVCLAPGS